MRFVLFTLAALASPLAAQDAPVLFDSSRAAPVAPGQWSYAVNPAGSTARFAARFAVTCDRATRIVTLRRLDGDSGAMTITTDLGTRTVAAGGAVAASDPLLDAVAFSRGRFIVDGAGGRLIVPASPEAARSIEDCRN